MLSCVEAHGEVPGPSLGQVAGVQLSWDTGQRLALWGQHTDSSSGGAVLEGRRVRLDPVTL